MQRNFTIVQASSQNLSTLPGGNALTANIDILPIRGPQNGLYHVAGFILRATGLRSAVPIAPNNDVLIDSVVQWDLLKDITLRYAPSGPAAMLATTMNTAMSGYVLGSLLAAATGAPSILNSGGKMAYDAFPQFLPSGSKKNGRGTFTRRDKHGHMSRQAPDYHVPAGTVWAPDSVDFYIPVGERPSENGCMDLNPAFFWKGGGLVGGCTGADGSITFALRSGTHNFLLANSNVTFELYAKVVELDEVNIPVLFNYDQVQTSQTILSTNNRVGATVFWGLIEELDRLNVAVPAGSMLLSDLIGLSLLNIELNGVPLYPPKTGISDLYSLVSQMHGDEVSEWAFRLLGNEDVMGPSPYDRPNNAFRYDLPGQIFVHHRGPLSRAPTDWAKAVNCLKATLNGVSSVNRNMVEVKALAQTDEYVRKTKAYAGVPESAEGKFATAIGVLPQNTQVSPAIPKQFKIAGGSCL